MNSHPEHPNEKSEKQTGYRWPGERTVRTQEESIDELLELIWILREKGVMDMETLLQNTTDPEARAVLNQMMREELFEMEGDVLKFKEK